MTESQTRALAIVKKKKIKSASKLAKEMKVSRQRADIILKSLQELGIVKYQPAQWIIL